MKSLKIKKDQLFCLIEDAIFYENDMYSRIKGDIMDGFVVEKAESIESIKNNGWSELYPSLEDKNNEFKVIAGETSWGGTGFVGLINIKTNSFQWMIHLSTMNNPIKVKIEKDFVRLTTDLNYPNGIDFLIPLQKPENFSIEKPLVNSK